MSEEVAEFSEWDSWDKVASVQHANPSGDSHANSRRNWSSSTEPANAEPPPEPDYFSDLGLAPTIRKQKKVADCQPKSICHECMR